MNQQTLDAAWRLVLAQLTDDPAITGAVLESCDEMDRVAIALAGMMAGAFVQFHRGDRVAAAHGVAATIGQPLELTPAQLAFMEQRHRAIYVHDDMDTDTVCEDHEPVTWGVRGDDIVEIPGRFERGDPREAVREALLRLTAKELDDLFGGGDD